MEILATLLHHQDKKKKKTAVHTWTSRSRHSAGGGGVGVVGDDNVELATASNLAAAAVFDRGFADGDCDNS